MNPSTAPKWGRFDVWQWIGWAVAAVIVVAIAALISHRGARRSLLHSASMVLAIARVTAAETLRKKVLYVILVFAVGCLLAINFLTSFEPNEQDTMVKDVGLALISLFAGLVVIVNAMFLIPEEVERRTIYPLLAKPVRRAEFVVGKFVGVMTPVAISMAVMLIVLMVMLAVKFHIWPWVIVMAVALMFLAMMVLAGVVILVSTRVATIVAALVGVVIYALGFNMGFFLHMAEPEHAPNTFNAVTLGLLTAIMPNLAMFDMRMEAALPPPHYWDQIWALCGNAVLYGVGYLAVLLIAASLLFSTREV